MVALLSAKLAFAGYHTQYVNTDEIVKDYCEELLEKYWINMPEGIDGSFQFTQDGNSMTLEYSGGKAAKTVVADNLYNDLEQLIENAVNDIKKSNGSEMAKKQSKTDYSQKDNKKEENTYHPNYVNGFNRSDSMGVIAGKSVAEKPVAEISKTDSYLQYRDGLIHKLSYNEFYFEGRTYSKKDIQSLVITTCPAAEQYYNTAKKWVIGGWSGAGAGVALIITGAALLGVKDSHGRTDDSYYDDDYYYYGDYYYSYYKGNSNQNNNDALTISGAVLLSMGCAALASSLPIAIIGHHRINNIHTVYNNSCAHKHEPPMTLNFGPTRNGMGMTLYF